MFSPLTTGAERRGSWVQYGALPVGASPEEIASGSFLEAEIEGWSDISYANSFQPQWDHWANQIEALTSEVPLVVAPGNHEAKDYYGETYRRRFSRPNQDHNWFSFDYHNVHFVSTTAGAFLTEHDTTTARDLLVDELIGLEIDVAQAAARRAAGEIDFIVVTQHFPLYTNHRTSGPFSPELVAAEEQILQRYQVDLLLVGHDHMYQRSLPMAYGLPVPGGAMGYVQIVAGGGISLYDFTPIGDFSSTETDPENPFQRQDLWTGAQRREWSFVEYEVRWVGHPPAKRATIAGGGAVGASHETRASCTTPAEDYAASSRSGWCGRGVRRRRKFGGVGSAKR